MNCLNHIFKTCWETGADPLCNGKMLMWYLMDAMYQENVEEWEVPPSSHKTMIFSDLISWAVKDCFLASFNAVLPRSISKESALPLTRQLINSLPFPIHVILQIYPCFVLG